MLFLPFDFTKTISEILGKVVNFAFSFFISILDKLFEIAVILIKEALYGFLYQYVLVPLFKVLEVMQQCVDILAGARQVTYYGQADTLINVVVFRSPISVALRGVTIISILVAAFFAFITFSRLGSDEENTAGKAVGRVGRCMLTFLLIPVMVMAGLNLLSTAMTAASNAVNMSGTNHTISKSIFLSMTFGAEKNEDKSNIGDGTFDTGIRAEYLSGAKDYMNAEQVFSDFHKTKLGVLTGVILTLFFIILFLMALLLFVSRLVEIAMLYTVSPYFAAFIPMDDGEKFGQWRDIFIAKLASGFGLLLGMKIFTMVIVPVVMSPNIKLVKNPVTLSGMSEDSMLRIILLAGLGFSVYKGYSIVTEIINMQVAQAEHALGNTAVQAARAAVNGGVAGVAAMFAKKQMEKTAGDAQGGPLGSIKEHMQPKKNTRKNAGGFGGMGDQQKLLMMQQNKS